MEAWSLRRPWAYRRRCHGLKFIKLSRDGASYERILIKAKAFWLLMDLGLKEEFLNLLEKDKEFRYAVAGLLGLEEILRRLDRHEEELVRLREDMNKGFRRHDEEIAKLREDMNKLREDMNKGFMLVERHISALGARWGLISEEAFREGLRGIIESELGLKVERWTCYDGEGEVFGYPSQIEVDVAIHDGRTILIEVKSHATASDVSAFARKARLYALRMGREPSRKLIVTPYAEDEALEAARRLGIEVYTKV